MTRTTLRLLLILLLSLPLLAGTTVAEEPHYVQLSNVTGAVVTLYYYNESTGMKGDIVPMADNPQVVNSDPSAPGMFTFTRVPAGRYYLEANNSGRKYFAIVTVTYGTSTANVHIPGWNQVNETITPDTTVMPSLSPVPTPYGTPSPSAKATPGLTAVAALLAIAITRKMKK